MYTCYLLISGGGGGGGGECQPQAHIFSSNFGQMGMGLKTVGQMDMGLKTVGQMGIGLKTVKTRFMTEINITILFAVLIFQLNRVWYYRYLFSIMTNFFRFLPKNDENDARVANLFLNFWSNGHGGV